MKKVFLLLFLSLIVFLPLEVNALSVSKNNLSIDKGNNETIELYAEVEKEIKEVSFSLVYTSYDVPAYFNIEPGLKDEANGIRHKIAFSEPTTGKIRLGNIKINAVNNPKSTSGTVNIHTATAITSDGEKINLSTQMINVTINKTKDTKPTEEEHKENIEINNMLSKIESEIVNIELKKDVFEYTIKIKEDVTELDLKPIAIDEKYEIEISNQKISELTDNQIIITVKDDEHTEEYKITVKVIEDIEPEIDEEEFESTFQYKGKWTTLIIIFCITLFVGLFLNKKTR